MKRRLTKEQITAKFGSIEKYEAYRAKVSVYRKKRRAAKKAAEHNGILRKMFGAVLGLFL